MKSPGKAPGCPRCEQPVAHYEADLETESHADDPTYGIKDWRVDDRLRQMKRSLRSPLVGGSASSSGYHWLDSPYEIDTTQPKRSPIASPNLPASPRNSTQWLAWISTTFGLGLSAGGAGLLGMALVGDMPEFWQWGVGTALLGQALLVGGLVWVLMSLWASSRIGNWQLGRVTDELTEVGRTTESLLAQRPGGSSSFYADLARGASPTTLIANLQGQVEQLSTHLHAEVNRPR